MTEVLKQQNTQVSDSESSISERDCEAQVNTYQDWFTENVKSRSPKSRVASSRSESTCDVTQEAINVKILAEHETLSKCLDSTEQSTGKQGVEKVKSQKVKRKVAPLGHSVT